MSRYISRDEMMKHRLNIRMTGDAEAVHILASKIVDEVEAMGQRVIEWSKEYAVQEDLSKVHVYLNIDTKVEEAFDVEQ